MAKVAAEDGHLSTVPCKFDDKEIVSKLKLIDCFSPEVFKKNALRSLLYFARDVFLAGFTITVIYNIKDKEGYFQFLVPVLQFLAGFLMWCIFVSVHDAGHGSFSNSDILNQIVGEIGNSICLCTPFYCWKLSHHRHHLHHNHVEKDYSFTWIPESKYNNNKAYFAIVYNLRHFLPFFGWPIYQFAGWPDGGHLILYGRNIEGRSWPTYLRMWMSAIVTMCSMYTIGSKLGWDALTVYVVPWIWYGWWLVTVTYLQHHDEGMKVFTDEA
jgi:omega-3 fatty acid desaturase (delta-15 desaturase)